MDTIEHHLVECEATLKFCKMIFNWWATNDKLWFQVETYEILFGIPNDRGELAVNQLNYITLIAKYYIYCQKQKAEMFNATGKIDTFNKRWGEFIEYL